jgi:predicted dehydrogenase
MKSVRALRVGLTGLGRFGSMHANILSSLPDVELYAIAEPREDQLQHIGREHNIKHKYKTTEELINNPELDAIIIVTPDDFHYHHCRFALATGKHIFIEKPLAGNSNQAKELMQIATEKGSILQVGLLLRYETNHRLLHGQINQNKFGDLISIRTKRNLSNTWFAAIADRVHTVYESAIHDIDLLIWLTNSEPICVSAFERRLSNHLSPEACIALIKFKNGCIGILETSWFVPEGAPVNVCSDSWNGCIDSELEIVGTNQVAKLSSLDNPLQIWNSDGINAPESNLWPMQRGRINGALREELTDFTNCARSGKVSQIANLAQAVKGLQLADAIIESALSGNSVNINK